MKIFIIPDTQVKPGVPLNHLEAAGNYIADKKPDVVEYSIVNLSSLTYTPLTQQHEGDRMKIPPSPIHI